MIPVREDGTEVREPWCTQCNRACTIWFQQSNWYVSRTEDKKFVDSHLMGLECHGEVRLVRADIFEQNLRLLRGYNTPLDWMEFHDAFPDLEESFQEAERKSVRAAELASALQRLLRCR